MSAAPSSGAPERTAARRSWARRTTSARNGSTRARRLARNAVSSSSSTVNMRVPIHKARTNPSPRAARKCSKSAARSGASACAEIRRSLAGSTSSRACGTRPLVATHASQRSRSRPNHDPAAATLAPSSIQGITAGPRAARIPARTAAAPPSVAPARTSMSADGRTRFHRPRFACSPPSRYSSAITDRRTATSGKAAEVHALARSRARVSTMRIRSTSPSSSAAGTSTWKPGIERKAAVGARWTARTSAIRSMEPSRIPPSGHSSALSAGSPPRHVASRGVARGIASSI